MSLFVTVEQGTLCGEWRTTCDRRSYCAFEGIPYAKPPVGKLRFRDPQEPDSWAGVRDATKPGNKCAQINFHNPSQVEGSEDCLYLNIYTPRLPSEKNDNLPVLFFVHGGRLVAGYGDYYQPDYFLRHDVILVTINYRLNILGLLCLNILEAPGNCGLKDSVMALKWVNKNIRKFNGDCNNITVFGESAGAAMVTSYLTSKMTDGLFNKVIAESGNLLSHMYISDDDPVEKGKFVAALLGQDLSEPKSIYDFLVDVSLDELLYGFAMAEMSREPHIIKGYFLPVIEKKIEGAQTFFEEDPIISIRNKRCKRIPVIVGMNSYEYALFVNRDQNGKVKYDNELQHYIPHTLYLKKDSPESIKLARKLREYYFKGKDVSDHSLEVYLNFLSEARFNADTFKFAEEYSEISEEIYFYKFCYCGEMNTRIMKNLGIKGASHGDILPYQFYRKSKVENSSAKDRKVVDFINEAWCNFAKTGKPSWTNQQSEWLPYHRMNRRCLLIDEEPILDTKLVWNNYDFWNTIIEERSKL